MNKIVENFNVWRNKERPLSLFVNLQATFLVSKWYVTAVWICGLTSSQITCLNFPVNSFISTYVPPPLPELNFLPEAHFPLYTASAISTHSAQLDCHQQTALLLAGTRNLCSSTSQITTWTNQELAYNNESQACLKYHNWPQRNVFSNGIRRLLVSILFSILHWVFRISTKVDIEFVMTTTNKIQNHTWQHSNHCWGENCSRESTIVCSFCWKINTFLVAFNYYCVLQMAEQSGYLRWGRKSIMYIATCRWYHLWRVLIVEVMWCKRKFSNKK